MPNAYTAGDPINTSDASGLCSWLGCIGAAVIAASQATGVCLRNPFGGNNGNGGCETTLSTTQAVTDIGVTLSVAAAATGVGGLLATSLDASILGSEASALAVSSIGYGVGGAVLDGLRCASGSAVSCDAAALDGVGLTSGIGALLLPAGSVFGLGLAGFSANLGVGSLSIGLIEAIMGGRQCGG